MRRYAIGGGGRYERGGVVIVNLHVSQSPSTVGVTHACFLLQSTHVLDVLYVMTVVHVT